MRIEFNPIEKFTDPVAVRNGAEPQRSFGAALAESLARVNALQHEADRAAASLAVGRAENLHNVMITTEQAFLALQLVVTVRNRVVEAYQEISRMQV